MKREIEGYLRFLTLIALVAIFAGSPAYGSTLELHEVAIAWAEVVDQVTMEPTGEEFFIDLNTGLVAETLPSTNAHQAACGGQIIFEINKDSRDMGNHRHLKYKQKWIPPKDLVDKHFAFRGKPIAINGGDLGFHSFKGQLHTVNGSYFEDINSVARPGFFDFDEIYSLASAAIDRSIPLKTIGKETRQRIQDEAELLLDLTEGGKGLTLLSKIKVLTDEPGSRNVLVDNSTGKVVSFSNPTTSFCNPDPQGDYREEAYQDSDGSNVPPGIFSLYTDPIYADKVFSGTDLRDYEAYWRPSLGMPPMVAWGVGDSGCSDNRHYGILPVEKETVGGVESPVYRDYNNAFYSDIPGAAAGDALRHTSLTVQMLRSHGVVGFGNGFTLGLLIDAGTNLCPGGLGVAAYIHEAVVDPYYSYDVLAPQGSVVFCEGNGYVTGAASLEIVAHEWGHRLIYASANFDRNTEAGGALHEGFADIVGYTMEWTHHGPLHADWTNGEDIKLIGRRVDIADAYWDEKLKYHKDDMSYDQNDHAIGNMLPVSFRLMADGGQNPVCSAQTLSGCSNPPVPGIGIDAAFDVYYRALTEYLYPDDGWDQVRGACYLAARDLSGDGLTALPTLKVAVIGLPPIRLCVDFTPMIFSTTEAFKAIGYPTRWPISCDVPY